MYTFGAFTEMLQEFLGNLAAMFPDHAPLQEAKTIVNLAVKADAKSVVDRFMKEIQPFADRIRTRDTTVFADASKGDLFQHLHLDEIWARKLSDKTRESIWSYLNTLLVIGTMLTSLSPDMLSTIEGMAEKIAANPEQMDLAGLMQNFGKLMQQ